MDKKIILVLLILLVLAIYYCYTHESFTENFKSVAEIVKGGVIENFELVSIVGSALTAKSSNGGYTFYAGGATDAGGVAGNSLDLHAYKGDGSYQGHLATFRNNNVTDFYGPVNASGKITSAGRDLLAEIDALRAGSAGNATKGGTDTNKAIEDLGKIAAQLLNSGNLTVPGNLTTAGDITGGTLQAKNSNGKYTFFAGNATDAGGVAGNSLDLHAYKGDGSWMGTLATFRNNKTTDFYGPVNATAINAPQLQAKNSNGGYIFFAGNATDAGGVAGNSLDLHAYKGDGSYQGHLATFRNNGTTDFYGPVNVKGRNILAELDALKADKISARQIVYLKRVLNDDSENAYFVGDNQHWDNKGNNWSKWRIFPE